MMHDVPRNPLPEVLKYVSLPRAESYPDLASLSHWFLNRGFTTVQALMLREIRRRYIGPQELQRLSSCVTGWRNSSWCWTTFAQEGMPHVDTS
ncbi:hypothetical protein BJV78DRAFT_1204056 [Lactifluus subvellereus]|nr:hypothetical protein BJV78DRAFT_1204056 [Lactifluus subvellereus]